MKNSEIVKNKQKSKFWKKKTEGKMTKNKEIYKL